MGVTGKYNFTGIQKTGKIGVKAALASTPWTAWLLKFGSLLDLFIELGLNWMANRGLIILNVGLDRIKGSIDQKGFDNVMDEAFEQIKNAQGADKLTPEQVKAIDDEVIKATRKLVIIGKLK